MNYGKYLTYYKAARMLQADRAIGNIEQTNFHSIRKEDRSRIMRSLRQAATAYLHKEVKDYREVLGNLAKRLMEKK